MAIDRKKSDAARDTRCNELAHLLGIRETEAADRSLSGRLKIIAKLKAARRVEIARGRAGSWLYDVYCHPAEILLVFPCFNHLKCEN